MIYRAVILAVGEIGASAAADDAVAALIERLPHLDATLVHRAAVQASPSALRASVEEWLARADLILTTGGIGLAAADRVPEALEPILDTGLPGLGELVRARLGADDPRAALLRTGGGVAGRTLIVWLPSEPEALAEQLTLLAPAIKSAAGRLRTR